MTPRFEPIDAQSIDAFLAYLDDHIADNGNPPTGYFLPIPRGAAVLPPDKAQSFREGLRIEVGKPGWRRAFVARSATGAIAGHVDLRAWPERFTVHRALLGMGVHREHRRRGVGELLLRQVIAWAQEATSLVWIDLQVLSANTAARRLYERCGFVVVGEIADMFRFDDASFAYTAMACRVR